MFTSLRYFSAIVPCATALGVVADSQRFKTKFLNVSKWIKQGEVIRLLPSSPFILANCDSQTTLDTSSLDEKNLRLVFASVYFRHGTRTPIHDTLIFGEKKWDVKIIEKDTSDNFLPITIVDVSSGESGRPFSFYDIRTSKLKLNGDVPGGILTKGGQDLSLELGKDLKTRYCDNLKLLDGKYNNREIKCYSTNFDRTIYSMQAVLKGMFGNSINKANIAVIETRRNELEHNFPNFEFCPSLKRWKQWVSGTSYSLKQCDDMRIALTRILGSENLLPPPSRVWDEICSIKVDYMVYLNFIKSTGGTIPSEYEEILEAIEKCVSYTEKYEVFGETILHMRNSLGKIVDDIMKHMEGHIEMKENSAKFQMTACHDTTILAIASAFGFFDEKWPKLCCYIAFELYKDITTVFNS